MLFVAHVDDGPVSYPENERIGHLTRRLGFGITTAAPCVDDAVLMDLDLSTATPEPTDLVVPKDPDDARTSEQREAPYTYEITQMITVRIEPRTSGIVEKGWSASSDRTIPDNRGKEGPTPQPSTFCCLAVISVPYVVSQQESRQVNGGSCHGRKTECVCES